MRQLVAVRTTLKGVGIENAQKVVKFYTSQTKIRKRVKTVERLVAVRAGPRIVRIENGRQMKYFYAVTE